MYKRIFTFGCSYTYYSWPTWADIIIKEFEEQGIPGYNFGIHGLGNVGIYHVMLQAHIKYKFTEDDLILVLWTTYNREDRLKDGVWRAGGGVFNNDYYDGKFVRKYWDLSNDLVKNYSAIISANLLIPKLKNMAAGTFEFTGRNANDSLSTTYSEMEEKIIKFYKDSLPPVLNIEFEGNIYKQFNDGHPDILDHLRVAKKIASINNFSISKKTKVYYNELHNKLLNLDNRKSLNEYLVMKASTFHDMRDILSDE